MRSRRPAAGGRRSRLSNWAVSPWLVPMPTCPAPKVESVTVPTVAAVDGGGDGAAGEASAPGCASGSVPSADVVPLRSVVSWPTGVVAQDRPGAGVADPQVVGVQAGRVDASCGADAADQLDVAGLSPAGRRRRPCSCSSSASPSSAYGSAEGLPGDRRLRATSAARTCRTGRRRRRRSRTRPACPAGTSPRVPAA